MAAYNKKLIDKRFHNWIKAALGVNITKEGIGDLVLNEITKFHTDILSEVLSPEQILNKFACTICTTESILTCPTKGICVIKGGSCSIHKTSQTKLSSCPTKCCEKVRDRIRQYHKYNCPSWKNTRVEYWLQNPWEIAKCYMPPDGYSSSTSPSDTDLNGIVSVMMNFTVLGRKVDDIACAEVIEKNVGDEGLSIALEKINVFSSPEHNVLKAREVGKQVRHSSDLHLNDRLVNTFLDTLVDFLLSSEDMKSSRNVQESILQIKKLKIDEITITTKDIKILLKTEVSGGTAEEAKEATKIKALEEIRETYLAQDSKAEVQSLTDTKTLQIGPPTTSDEKNPQSSYLCYELLKKNLKTDLLTFNKMSNGFIPLSPMFEEYDASLLQFYVPPVVRLVDQQNSGQDSYYTTEGVALRSYRDIFNSKVKQCRNIYVTAAAGLGKTTFSRKLALTWCLSHDLSSEEAKKISEDDLAAMKEFEFVFLISLRDSSKLDCEIDNMIYNQIIQHLSRSFLYTMNFLQEALHKETCLVILDGLDEWSHPPPDKSNCRKKNEAIPHRKLREHCTIFTTTRPWKLDLVNLKYSQIDKQIELVGLDNISSAILIETVLHHLKTRFKLDVGEAFEKFNEEVRCGDVEELKTIPLILMHLIGLWSDRNSLGRSKSEIYVNITEMLLSRAEQKCEDIGIILQEGDTQSSSKGLQTLFDIFKEKSYCAKYHHLLTVLGHVAFETLFSTSREQSLVFNPEIAQRHMKEKEIYFFYKTGLLTRSLFRQQLTRRISTISFAHRTFQEFFASFYIGSVSDCSPDLDYIFNRCRTVESIVEMANVFTFESGIAPARASLISQKLFEIVETTPLTLKYRSNACFLNYWNHLSVMKKLQNMHVECMQENKSNGHDHIRLHLADYLIDEKCNERKYRTTLINLMQHNTKEVKSVHINGFNDPSEISEMMQSFGVSKIDCLQRLDIWGKVDQEDLNFALEASVHKLKYLLVHSGIWLNNRWIEQYMALSDKTLATVQRIHKLETLSLWTIALTHSQLEGLMIYLSKRVPMQQIGFGAIKCLDHSEDCPGVYLDLSEHSDLQILHLNKIPLSVVNINVSSLEECHIGEFPTEGVLSSILDCLPNARKLHTFGCYYMTSERDVDKMLHAISILENLRYISLILVNMGDRSLELKSNMKYIENVKLKRVTMSSYAMNRLLASSELLQQSIRIDIMNCNITPDDEFAKMKRYVRTSDKFVVIEEGIDHRKRNAFSFTTKQLSA